MKTLLVLILVAVGIIATAGTAIAGHEWTDGTMGPRGQSYDTTMPIFRSEKRIPSKQSETPSRACDSRVLASTTTAQNPTTTRDSGEQGRSNAQPTAFPNEHEICRNQTQ